MGAGDLGHPAACPARPLNHQTQIDIGANVNEFVRSEPNEILEPVRGAGSAAMGVERGDAADNESILEFNAEPTHFENRF